MKKRKKTLIALAATLLSLANINAETTTLASLRSDFVAAAETETTANFNDGKGISDTHGSGYWNYYESDAADGTDYADGSTMEALVYALNVGDTTNPGYRDPENGTWSPIVTNASAFSNAIALDDDKLTLHPGDEDDEKSVVARWTAGTGEASDALKITGEANRAVDKANGGDGRILYIYHVSADATTYTLLFEQDYTGIAIAPVTFDLTTAIAEGEHIDFVVNRIGNHNADEMQIAATLSIDDDTNSVAETVTIESLLNEMVDRESITRFPTSEFKAREFSSYNRASVTPDEPVGWFTNNDYNGKYIRTEVNDGRTEYVLSEHNSPGAIVRSWVPWHATDNATSTQTIRIYLDGSDEPAIEGNLLTLFDGTGLIPYPFAHPSLRSAVSFFPIPYAQSCKITVDENPFFYIFTHREYEEGTDIKTFTIEDFNASSDLIASTGEKLLDPQNNVESGTDSSIQTSIAADEEVTLDLPTGSAAVREITLAIESEISDQSMRTLVVKAEFDGMDTIWCPIGDFFGTGVGINPFEGWSRTVAEDGVFSCRWVMPYQTSGKISLHNLADESVQIDMNVVTSPYTWDEQSMYFYSAWRSQYPLPTRPRSDWNYVTIESGRGVYVGDTLTLWNPSDRWWGEGDHKIWVDDDTFPSLFGTGTEDYYAYSWGGRSTDFYEHPFHAQPRAHIYNKLNRKTIIGERNTLGYSVETRSRTLDTIPFQDRLQLDMEVWHGQDVDMDYSVATHWYAEPTTIHNRVPDPDNATRATWDLDAEPTLSLIQDDLDFGVISVGSTANKTITLVNSGGQTLIGSISAEPPFSVVSGSNRFSLSAASKIDVIIEYAPTVPGNNTASLTISTDEVIELALSGQAFNFISEEIASLRGDYMPANPDDSSLSLGDGNGIVDTDGSGFWNYYESDAIDASDYADGSTLDPLIFSSEVGLALNSGYRDPENSTWTPIIGDGIAFADAIPLDPTKLSLHPGDEEDEASVVARWTSGNDQEIYVSGTFMHGSSNADGGDGRSFYLFKSSTDGTNNDLLYEATVETAATNFEISTSINAGQHIDFVVNRGGSHGADEVHLEAVISLIDSDEDTLPDWWESIWTSNLTDLTIDGDFDEDGVSDVDEYTAGTNPALDPSVDTDEDGINDGIDTDDDNDGVEDAADAFPLDASESLDTDLDGIGNNADTDDDNDGVLDLNDALPLDSSESVDTDSDGIGDNADTDDDGDGVLDIDETSPKLINISTRGFVLDGEKIMIAGFVIDGTSPKRILVQGVGSELDEDPFFIDDNVMDTTITVYDGDQVEVATNDDWDSTLEEMTANTAASDAVGSFVLLEDSKSSALILTLEPGLYTATLRDVNGAGGVALIEVYEMPTDE